MKVNESYMPTIRCINNYIVKVEKKYWYIDIEKYSE
jgi:hypothetical protein